MQTTGYQKILSDVTEKAREAAERQRGEESAVVAQVAAIQNSARLNPVQKIEAGLRAIQTVRERQAQEREPAAVTA